MWIPLRESAAHRALLLMTSRTSAAILQSSAVAPIEAFSSLFDRSLLGVAAFDAGLRITSVNGRLLKMLRASRAKLLSSKIGDIVVPDDRREVSAWLQPPGHDERATLEFCVAGSLGRRRHVQALAIRVPENDARPEAGGLLLMADVTSQKKNDLSLLQQAEFNKTLLNNTSALIVVYDTKGIVRHISRAVEDLFGYTNEAVCGKCIWKIGVMPQSEVDRSRKRLRDLKGGRSSIQSTMRLLTTKGEVRTMEIISTAVPKLTGGVDCIIATGTDITERERLQQEVLRVAEAEQSRIGHDLHDGVGQSLTGIVALMEALESQTAGPQLTLARRVREQLQSAIRELRRVAHGMTPIAIRERGLAEALMALAETVRESFRTACSCTVDEHVGSPAADVHVHLFRIAQEAVSNALRHGRATRIKITLKRVTPDTCELRVQDNGTGIERGRNETDGIGLRVMRYRADMIGGSLDVTSKAGNGVAVCCRFTCLKKQK